MAEPNANPVIDINSTVTPIPYKPGVVFNLDSTLRSPVFWALVGAAATLFLLHWWNNKKGI